MQSRINKAGLITSPGFHLPLFVYHQT